MAKIGIIIAVTVTGFSVPAPAQDNARGYSSYVYQSGPVHGDVQSYGDRLVDFRRIVAKRTIRDGGTLSDRDRVTLERRLTRIVAEENVRQHPVWPGITG